MKAHHSSKTGASGKNLEKSSQAAQHAVAANAIHATKSGGHKASKSLSKGANHHAPAKSSAPSLRKAK